MKGAYPLIRHDGTMTCLGSTTNQKVTVSDHFLLIRHVVYIVTLFQLFFLYINHRKKRRWLTTLDKNKRTTLGLENSICTHRGKEGSKQIALESFPIISLRVDLLGNLKIKWLILAT